MTPPNYNQALLDMATQSLAELARTAEQKAGKRTPAQESHFLCTWMADSLKEKRFSRLVMEDLKGWIQQGRIRWEETVFDGIGKAPDAFVGLFSGSNTGKMLVKLA